MRSRRLPSSHCCLTPRRHARAVNGLQATPPLLGPCGASTPSRVAAQPRQIRQSGAKPEPGELQELQLGAWPSSPLESDLAAAACRVGSCGEDQREDVQWLSVGALEIRSIVVGSTGLLCMRSRSLLELRLRMRRLCVGPCLACRSKCAFAFARCWKQAKAESLPQFRFR